MSHASSGCPPVTASPSHCSPQCCPALLHPMGTRAASPAGTAGMSQGSGRAHGEGCCLLQVGKGSAGTHPAAQKARKAGSRAGVHNYVLSVPVRTASPALPPSLPANLSLWTLQFYWSYSFPLDTTRSERERNSTGKKRRISRKGVWVRTRESGGGLSKGSKGGLLHSQLVELGQLLRGRRDIRAKKVIVIEYNKSHQKSRTKL